MRSRQLMWIALALLLAFDAWHWAQIEAPRISLAEMLVLAALGVVPALVSSWRGPVLGWLVALPAAALAAIGVVVGRWPWHAPGSYPGSVWDTISRGVRQWFQTHTPFDGSRAPTVDHDVQLAFFALSVVIAWLIVCRRAAVPAIGVAFVGFALPSTVVTMGNTGFRAAIFLGLSLLLLRALTRMPGSAADSGHAFGVGTAVVAGALVVAALPGVAKQPFLNWHSWNPLANTGPQVSVSYVWNQTYAPLHWPKKQTVMFEAWAPRPMYWTVGRLDTFQSTRWVMDERPAFAPVRPGTPLPEPPSQVPPGAARHPTSPNIATIRVKIDGLADPHLVGGGQPVLWHPPSDVQAVLNTDGSALASHDLARGAVYSSQAYVANPTATTLVKASHRFPPDVVAGLVVNGQKIPLWPKPGPAHLELSPWLVRASNEAWHASGADTANTEWDATADVESYLRAAPFVYSQKTVYTGPIPVLAQFLLTKHSGYCQMYSGAMALILRLHGIPARVAVGFTTGTQSASSGAYVVTDRDAHAWVETYFPGWGWQQFDPTPTRHNPSASDISNQQTRTELQHALNSQTAGLSASSKANITNNIFHGNTPGGPQHNTGLPPGKGSVTGKPLPLTTSKPWRPGFFTAVFLLAALVVALLAVAKLAAVRWRYLRRGPRAQAAAAYHELSTFLGDQGVAPQSSRTFEELARELDRVYGVDGIPFAQAASRARYGPDRGARGAEREMRKELRVVKRGVRRQLSWRERATGSLRLRATLSQTTSME
ncbi:MAG: transglutaminase TgpA family protein [Gaiellales bacterium]